MNLKDLNTLTGALPASETMPVLFLGHGSPMNAIEENEFTRQWRHLGESLPRPNAILCVSAHWETRGTLVTAMEQPRTIHDFYGFPRELFDVQYPAPGSATLAGETQRALHPAVVELDHRWGLDHGCWSVVRRIYPNADVPIVQLSLDRTLSPEQHVDLAAQLASLREKGILIIGSGNMVHNLGIIDWEHPDGAYDWADEAAGTLKTLVSDGALRTLADYPALGRAVRLSVPTPEHFLPMLYALALRRKGEGLSFFNDRTIYGSLSMASFIVSQ